MKLEIIATATFGLEAVVKREIENLGFKILKSEDGKITFLGDERAVIKANLWLRSADRVQIKMGEFMASEFEELFQQMKAIEWEQWIPVDGKFVVNGSSVKSKLSSVPACQSVAEKAIVERLKEFYSVDYFEKTGALYDIKITLLKDRVTVTLDTTGPGLHKRGYRLESVEAPIKETLAAAMVQLSFWKKDRILVDPCCGSGTIPIEAAMIGRNIAPGLNRRFVSEEWEAIPQHLWKEERKAAFEAIDNDTSLKIYGSDINPAAVKAAKANAEAAGVEDCIKFNVADVSAMKTKAIGGVMVTNPPYGERIGDSKVIDKIYESYNRFFADNPTWSLFAVTSDKTIEQKALGRPADRRRKLYNGRLEVCYYQFHGEKPPKKEE
ncbi:MAG: class I SAM-dependent RNA methyltransferase [Firmicutes bacterium]|nr:class I SAM-dependent RNA methyltransferase [Bacillota bacterium]